MYLYVLCRSILFMSSTHITANTPLTYSYTSKDGWEESCFQIAATVQVGPTEMMLSTDCMLVACLSRALLTYRCSCVPCLSACSSLLIKVPHQQSSVIYCSWVASWSSVIRQFRCGLRSLWRIQWFHLCSRVSVSFDYM